LKDFELFSGFENAPDDIIDDIEKMCAPMSECEERRIFKRIQQKSSSTKVIFETDNADEVRGVDIYMKPKWYKPVMAAVAAIAVIGGIAGSMTLMKNMNKTSPYSNADSSDERPLANTDKLNIANTEKLNFDNAIINIPSEPEVYQLTFDRIEWTKSELTKACLDCTNRFMQSLYGTSVPVTEKDLDYYYLDSIEGDRGEKIERNFYSLSLNREDLIAWYQHHACFYNAGKSDTDLGINKNISYINDADEETIKKAETVIEKLSTDFKEFFAISDYKMVPYAGNYENGCQYYVFGVEYNGILLDNNYYGSLDANKLSTNMAPNVAEAIVDSEGKIIYVTSYYNWTVTKDKTYDKIISAEEACKIVDDEISDHVNFDISRLDLIYRIDEVRDEKEKVLSWSGTPCYKFTVNQSGIAAHPRLSFFVNAVTGEFSSFSIVR